MTSSKNIYKLPFDEKLNLKPEPAPFHYESGWLEHAVDFAMPIGTPILAALDGVVNQVIDGFNEGGPDKSYLDKSNLIIIEHSNKEYSCYVHLRKGKLVNVGDRVKEGEIIAYSGISGYHTYPHLHFHVMTKKHMLFWQTIPTRFSLSEGIEVLRSPRQ